MSQVEDPESAVVRRLTDGLDPPAVGAVMVRCLGGEISPQVALMRLAIETESLSAVRQLVDEVTRRADSDSRCSDSMVRDRVDALTQVLVENVTGVGRIAAMLRSDMDSPVPAASVAEGIAAIQRLFDWSVHQSAEASVALYSLGSPAILDQATREILALFRSWGVLGADKRILQIGCGIGRLECALAPEVREAVGVDVSAEMVKVAASRCASLPNVRVLATSGRDLALFDDASFDLVYAVDTFPYLLQAGMPLVETHFAEARRVLTASGDFVILNYSYRDDLSTDRADIERLAAAHGLEIVTHGTRPFALWDGAAFHLRSGGGDP